MKLFRTFLISIIAIAMSFTIAAPSQAATPKLYLSGANAGTYGNNYSATVTIVPKKAGVAVSIYRLTLGGKVKLVSGKTNSAGKAVLKFKVTTNTLVISAFQSSNSAVKSASKRITVQFKTSLSVIWPDAITCGTDEVYVEISPKLAGRSVKLQWWSESDEMWKDDTTRSTNANGRVWIEIPDVSSVASYYQRIFVPASGNYLSATSPYVYLEFPACGSDNFEISGTAPGGTYYTLDETFVGNWEATGFDSANFVNGDATVYLDVCDLGYYDCDTSDEEMDTETNDEYYAFIESDDSGTFYWDFSTPGEYIIRLSVWDDGGMRYWSSWEVTVE